MKLIFEMGSQGRRGYVLDSSQVPHYSLKQVRCEPASFSQLSEMEATRHYVNLARMAYGVDNGMYPLGSCTMKYNPKVNEEIASLQGFNDVHPTQDDSEKVGCNRVIELMQDKLARICGMDCVTLQPAAGAHGEFTGMSVIKAYFLDKQDFKRKRIIVPDSAHGTNPASASMCGFEVVSCPSDSNGEVDVERLAQLVDDTTAGLMLTNPNTLGLFDRNILRITSLIHEAGGLCYYDGANLNAIMEICRPGDMGFDVMHLNVHKTFSTPHGGGGPGSGPVLCKKFLADYLPLPVMGNKPDDYQLNRSIGKVRSYYGNFPVYLKGLAYIMVEGGEGLRKSAQLAVLNANYLRCCLKGVFDCAYDRINMHEFVLCLKDFKDQTGVSALDVAKALIDFGIHPPTMYFPMIVHEALMFEPTETEPKENLDYCVQSLEQIKQLSLTQDMKQYPLTTQFGRADEVNAARNPVLRYVETK